MFCPKCGNADQIVNTYCRRCGTFLPDFDKIKAREIPPEQHLTVNSVLNLMTAIVSLTLAILLYILTFGKETTPFIIYVTAGFLIAMFAWQVQTFWRTRQLKKHFERPDRNRIAESETKSPASNLGTVKTRELLNKADFGSAVSFGMTGGTTNKLSEKAPRKSS